MSRPEAASPIEAVERDLLERAKTASIADLGTLAAAMKAVAETKFTELTARNKGRETRLEMFKSIAAFLVPMVSLLALWGTIYFQNKQLEATHQQIEDTEWRDLLSSLKDNPNAKTTVAESVYTDPTVAPRLRSFFASAAYGDQARSIAARLMGHISNPDGFADLFRAVFGDVTARNVDSALDINRTLLSSVQAIRSQCNDTLSRANIAYDSSGLLDCASYLDDAKAAEAIGQAKAPAVFTDLRRSVRQLEKESVFLNARIMPFLRANYHVPRDGSRSPPLDLSGQDMLYLDYSDLDLKGFDIAGAIFDTVKFDGAVIIPKNRVLPGPSTASPPDFRNSPWWEASYIEPTLLIYLTQTYFPYVLPASPYWDGYRITQDIYQAKVTALCRAARVACPLPLKYGTPSARSP